MIGLCAKNGEFHYKFKKKTGENILCRKYLQNDVGLIGLFVLSISTYSIRI